MMKMFFLGIVLCLTAVSAMAEDRLPSDTSLTDLNQNLAFRPKLQAGLFLDRPVVSHSFKLAKVHFVIDKSDKIGFEDIDQNFDHNDAERCKDLGFSLSEDCPVNYSKSRLCPYDNTYYDRCCDNEYKYTKAECSYPNTISSTSCGGKYKCYCDRSLYKFDRTNCSTPNIAQDRCMDDNGDYYSRCSCPSSWIICDRELRLIGNGTPCQESGEEDKYASCQCESGYIQTCNDYGPKTPSDYCFLKGTKYYKDCKTALEVCEGLGFTHSADNPCSADEVPDAYCPKNGSYFSCRVDPDKYCQNHGFTTGACGSYQLVGSEKCPFDTANIYHKCTHTCKSRVYEETRGKINFDGGLTFAGAPMVYLNSLTDNNFGTSAKIYRGPQSYNYEECQRLGRPTVSTSNNAETLLNGLTLSDFNLNLTTRSFNDFVVKEKLTLTRMKIAAPYSNDEIDIRPLGTTLEINNNSCYTVPCNSQTVFDKIEHIALREKAVLEIKDTSLYAPKMYIYVGSGSSLNLRGTESHVSTIASLRGESGNINIYDRQSLQVFGKLPYNEYKHLGLQSDCGASIVLDSSDVNLVGLLTTDGATYSFNSHYAISNNSGKFCAYDHCFKQDGRRPPVGMTIRGKVYSFKRKRYHYNYLSSGKCSVYPEQQNQWKCLDEMELIWEGRYPNGNCYTYDSLSQKTYGRECDILSYQ